MKEYFWRKYVYQRGDQESVRWLELMDVINSHYGPQYRLDMPVETGDTWERFVGKAIEWWYKHLDQKSLRVAGSPIT